MSPRVSRSRQCGFSAKRSQMCPPAPGASASFNPSNPLNKFKSPSSNLMESVRWIRSRRSPAFSRRPKIPRLRAVVGDRETVQRILALTAELKQRARALAKLNEEKIRKRAREIWEENNRPVGRMKSFGSRPNGNFAKLKISQTKSATTSNLLALLANGTNLSVDCLFCAATLLGLSGFRARHIECIR